MDGSMMNRMMTVGDIIESGMKKKLDFNIIRLQITKFLKNNGCYSLGTDRVGERAFVIIVNYWDQTGQRKVESFHECPSYTKAHPINAW